MSSNGNGRLEVTAREDEHDRREHLEAMTNLMCGNVRDFMEDFK